ncbi:DUF4124 domain-containing protein [Geothrix edaphica]|uniref:DUF4124 domain-containing protein n=1 Tax=Geothrix edaphica TaxID=2927976 RepID=A0ABQ5PYJ4_9BACT|nr:DUF4124 domain-containing protein [Geothrix edaphica]GLH67457.1 hypothetical protein GETHED_18210 [Geothrix edaphica]
MVTAVAGLLVLALLGQPSRTYYWRDTAGQTHVTNTPPPVDAEILEPPPPPAVERGRPDRIQPIRQSENPAGYHQVTLTPVQKQAWEALDQHLLKARDANDRRTLEAVADSLIHDCLWGNGLWVMPLAPLLSLVLLGLIGWWLALGLNSGLRLPLVGGFLLLGLGFGHMLLNVFLYHPQSARLQQNLQLLELHMGGRIPRPEHRALLQQRYQALEQAAEPSRAPWRFPGAVRALRQTVKQVMVDP